MLEHYEIESKEAGWATGMPRALTILGRVFKLDDDGAPLEADPALLEESLIAFGLVGRSLS